MINIPLHHWDCRPPPSSSTSWLNRQDEERENEKLPNGECNLRVPERIVFSSLLLLSIGGLECWTISRLWGADSTFVWSEEEWAAHAEDCMRGASLLRSLLAASPADDLTRPCPFGSHGRVNQPTFTNFSLRRSKILMNNIPKFYLKKITNSKVIRRSATTQM